MAGYNWSNGPIGPGWFIHLGYPTTIFDATDDVFKKGGSGGGGPPPSRRYLRQQRTPLTPPIVAPPEKPKRKSRKKETDIAVAIAILME